MVVERMDSGAGLLRFGSQLYRLLLCDVGELPNLSVPGVVHSTYLVRIK